MYQRKVVITGLGVVAPNGVGKDAFWDANLKGVSGIDKVASIDTSALDVHIGGEARLFDPLKFLSEEMVKRTDRFVHLGLSAAKMAVEDSGILLEKEDRGRIGVIIGSGLGGLLFHEEQISSAMQKGLSRIHPVSVPKITPNAVAGHVAIHFGLTGYNFVISTACSSGAHAVGEAFRKIQHGELDACICGGVEAPLTRFTYAAYASLRVLSKNNDHPQEASRPFDARRDGFVLAEGAGILLIEELEHALKRRAPIYAEVAGYAANSGAHHMVIPLVDGDDAAKVMAAAIKDAGLANEGINYINAHGTSTQANDKAETKAIKKVFGAGAGKVSVSSTKSMIGHTIGAAGGIEAVVCALAIKNDVVPPTINQQEKDPECDLDYVPNIARRVQVNAALSNSFGFGSSNVCLAFTKWRE